jgi:DNA-binding response OmpR family regulator
MTATQTIVVAEDSAFIREMIVIALRREGFEPAVACDGAEALALVREHRPQLLILDGYMPNGDGYDVCRELDAADEKPYVIMLTAAVTADDRTRALEAGADEVMAKPFSPQALRDRVKELFDTTLG